MAYFAHCFCVIKRAANLLNPDNLHVFVLRLYVSVSIYQLCLAHTLSGNILGRAAINLRLLSAQQYSAEFYDNVLTKY